MVRWCQENLAPVAHQFSFVHHDVFTAGFNPEASANVLELPVDSHSFDLVVAYSVFTHLVEDAAVWYLRECSRVLKPDGILLATWFLFDKRLFPMMQVFQNALYINLTDPTNAVIFDREWLRTAVEEAGLAITAAIPPTVRGYQWVLSLEPARSGRPSISLPEDTSQLGSVPPPLANVPPHLIGSEERITPAT
jgi:SAM-dependent methyltransferase